MTSDSFRVIYVWSGILRSFTNVCKTEKNKTKFITFTVHSLMKEMCRITGDRPSNSKHSDTVRCFASGPFPLKVNPPTR